jgi:phosphate starvation-inducible protein PhoH and related proteins
LIALPARPAASSRSLEFTLQPPDNHRLANLCGALDQNLKQFAAAFNVQINRRADSFSLTGAPATARRARTALEHFYALADKPLTIDQIQLGLVELERPAAPGDAPAAGEATVLQTRRSDLQGRTPNQREYLRNISSHDITFSIGPAGTGKTFLAVACAVDALERDAVKRIVLTRPAVEAGERLGFLPGDLAQKIDPYLRPLYDALYDLMGFERTARMFERQSIEIAPLAYMRGRTLNHAFIILDEAQNTTPEQMKMFLTRIGVGSKAVVTGDATQIDLPKGQASGLIEARRVLAKVRGIAFTEFDSSDVVRHPLVARIVDAYEQHDRQP